MAKLFFSTDDLAHGHFSRTKGEFSWRLTKAGCLTIEGTGELHQDIESCHGNSGDGWDSHFDWDETEWPWHTDILIPKVEKVVIGEGITSICAYAFRNTLLTWVVGFLAEHPWRKLPAGNFALTAGNLKKIEP